MGIREMPMKYREISVPLLRLATGKEGVIPTMAEGVENRGRSQVALLMGNGADSRKERAAVKVLVPASHPPRTPGICFREVTADVHGEGQEVSLAPVGIRLGEQ